MGHVVVGVARVRAAMCSGVMGCGADYFPHGAPSHSTGSVGLDGCSLTVAEVAPDLSKFRVSLIPHTLAVTILGELWQPGTSPWACALGIGKLGYAGAGAKGHCKPRPFLN